jgi:2,4-dienoyl-CoA reductase-like NADH-dependent reductase (Old Yellow Enzyme family)
VGEPSNLSQADRRPGVAQVLQPGAEEFRMVESLFQPLSLKSLSLENRFVMSPMTRYFSPGGVATDEVAAYYARRASNEVGLIITEGIAVDRPASVESPNVPRLHGDEALAGLQKVVDAVHAETGKIACQLWHVGAWYEQSEWTPPAPFEGPSGLKEAGNKTGVPMSEKDIEASIEAFAAAAANSVKLGFDAIDIHGAHGYLIDQFFWDVTNTREDRWGGGTLRDRSRFAVEVIKAVREAVGEDIAIFFRLSQWKIQAYEARTAETPQELEAWIAPLAEAGVDVFDCSQRRFWEPEFDGSDLNFAGWIKKVSGAATMTVGSVGLTTDMMASFEVEKTPPGSLDELVRRFERGDFDLVAVGRALLSATQWVRKIHEGRREELMDFEPAHLATLS